MNCFKAEFTKIIKTKFLWIVTGAYLVLFLLLFYQYTLNTEANVVEPILKSPVNLSSFFLIMFSAFFNVVFAVSLGTHLAAKDFTYNTIQSVIQSSGRYRAFISKIFVTLISSIFIVTIILVLGMVLGLFHEAIGEFYIIDLVKKCAVGIMSTFLTALFAMTVATISKSVSQSNVICFILLLGQSFLPFEASRYLYYVNPYYYISSFSQKVFSNLDGLSFISFRSGNTMTFFQSLLCLVAYFVICLICQFLTYRKREYV